jgi:hypothetical protein
VKVELAGHNRQRRTDDLWDVKSAVPKLKVQVGRLIVCPWPLIRVAVTATPGVCANEAQAQNSRTARVQRKVFTIGEKACVCPSVVRPKFTGLRMHES